MILIGLGFRKQSGKDTAGDLLVRNHGFRKLAFAAPLKTAAAAIFGFTDEQLNGSEKEVPDPFWGFTPRWALQELGTRGVRQAIREDVWVRSMEKKLSRIPDFVPGVVITDVRFPNEADMILRRGGHVYRVDRPGLPELGEHASETAMESYDRWTGLLDNSGTLADLSVRVNQLVKAAWGLQ